MRCVICGKEYKRSVTDAHLKSHRISKKKYAALAESLTEGQWEFYWTHPGIREKFPNPAAEVPEAGRALTFKQWAAKVADKHPELA